MVLRDTNVTANPTAQHLMCAVVMEGTCRLWGVIEIV